MDEWREPSVQAMQQASAEFDGWANEIEQSLSELFKRYPRNNDLNEVLWKVAALNSFYSTRIYAYSDRVPDILDVARHIKENAEEIDGALAVGSPEIVDFIASVDVPGKDHRTFSFATKYCSWHQRELYPIWDANVDRYLRRLKKETGALKTFAMGAEWKYPDFHRAMVEFKEIDKFLWVHGAE